MRLIRVNGIFVDLKRVCVRHSGLVLPFIVFDGQCFTVTFLPKRKPILILLFASAHISYPNFLKFSFKLDDNLSSTITGEKTEIYYAFLSFWSLFFILHCSSLDLSKCMFVCMYKIGSQRVIVRAFYFF